MDGTLDLLDLAVLENGSHGRSSPSAVDFRHLAIGFPRMDAETKEAIASTFQANLNRVRNLVGAYDALGGAGAGRPSVQQIDVLRSAVVLLHATLEDILRSSSEALLPSAPAGVLDEVGFPDGADKTKAKFTLGELSPYRGQTVDDLIRTAVQTRLQRSNYNSVAEVVAALARIGIAATVLDPEQGTLESIMKRRHLIVRRGDSNPTRNPGRGSPRTIHLPKQTVETWFGTVSKVGANIVAALPTT